jgi:hypothetical protein
MPSKPRNNPMWEPTRLLYGEGRHPLVVKHTLKKGHHTSFVVPQGGAKIANDGHVELTVSTPE